MTNEEKLFDYIKTKRGRKQSSLGSISYEESIKAHYLSGGCPVIMPQVWGDWNAYRIGHMIFFSDIKRTKIERVFLLMKDSFKFEDSRFPVICHYQKILNRSVSALEIELEDEYFLLWANQFLILSLDLYFGRWERKKKGFLRTYIILGQKKYGRHDPL